MTTRHKSFAGPAAQERYMSSNEFAELRGISGIAVAARAAVLVTAGKRDFIWWLQGQSLADGGLKRVARELLAMFPERIGTPEMHHHKVRAGKLYPAELVDDVVRTIFPLRNWSENKHEPKPGEGLIAMCREVAINGDGESSSYYYRENHTPSIEEFLIDLCINPCRHFSEPGEQTDFSSIEVSSAIEENPDLQRRDFKKATLPYFHDVIGALFEYRARLNAKAREDFYLTAIGRQIWETLDFAIAHRNMVLLDGLEGRGKTEAVKAWCALHLGTARFVSLKGITSKTTAFRHIAKALGIASSYTRTATEMQARIEDVLSRSKLMLVLDEAHFVFNQSRRMYTRPELVDWIDTAICNEGVPIALVTTPQFMICMTRAADQVEWNYRQFRRRVARWIKLPANNTEADIREVARHIFKSADAKMVSAIVGYAGVCKRDLSAVGDVVHEVRALLGSDDLSKATARHVSQAITEYLLPSDKTFAEGMAAARNTGRKLGCKPTKPADVESDEVVQPAPVRETRPAADVVAHRRTSTAADLIQA